jgi:hypothetical protein
MAGKFCRFCAKAEEVAVQTTRIEGTLMFSATGMVLNDSTTFEQSKGTIFKRGCSIGKGTETVEPFDWCIDKREFEEKPKLPG